MENLLLKWGWNEAKIHDECWPIFDGKESPQNFFGIWITVCSFFFKLTYPKSQLNKYSAHTKKEYYTEEASNWSDVEINKHDLSRLICLM